MERPAKTHIDQDACIGCGLCLTVCPSRTITMVEGRARVTGPESIYCGHCAAICPVGAVTVEPLENDALEFKTFQVNHDWLPHGRFDTSELVRLMLSRRSCRNYTDQDVPRELLEDLVRIGTTAPSGTNSQLWTFTILPDRKSVLALAERILKFFQKVNRMAANPLLRNFMKLVGRRELDEYYHNFYQSVTETMADWRDHGQDRLFHGAPALIIVGTESGAACPKEDAMLASQNMLLAGHSLGLGTCLVGYAVAAFENDPSLQVFLGIPRTETIHAAITVGYPAEKYQRLAGRFKVTPRYFKA
jgi:nitroreductase/NAD-dependent dihydropyrimidine dehydrogenase PreA subunit